MSDSTNGRAPGAGKPKDDDTTSATDDSSVGFNHQIDDDVEESEPSLQDAHNPETQEDTSSGGPAD